MTIACERAGQPRISVIIGLVSTEDSERILETLGSLFRNQGEDSCEIVLVDRRRDAVSIEILRRYPNIKLIDCPASTSLPEMRAIAFWHSHGEIVAVTEDHCVPEGGWLTEIISAFDKNEGVVAVGGSIENGLTDTGFDWATFLCEYSYFSPPVAEGITTILPGMNVAYRRSALAAVPYETMVKGFWETTVHPLLLQAGGQFLITNRVRIYHRKKFSRRLFLKQRFVYSRYYAGLRFERFRWLSRVTATVGSVILPPILLVRIIRACLIKNLRKELVRALPALVPLVVVWSAGEIYGYMFGPGNSLAQIE